MDDARHGRAVARPVPMFLVFDGRPAGVVGADDDAGVHVDAVAEVGMVGVDPAVDDRNLHPSPRRASPRPFLRDGPVEVEAGDGRQALGRELLGERGLDYHRRRLLT